VNASRSNLTTLLTQVPPRIPDGAEAMVVTIELPPGDPGSPPHRHSGPVFGYVIEGRLAYELEGRGAQVIRAGKAFWEPGGDLIHYRAGNASADSTCRFVVVMLGEPGQPMLVPVTDEELAARRGRRAPAED
jgi:quercetin dioxygenase-like cupin family protein